MTTTRVGHFSDTHVLALAGVGPRSFLNKRWTGAINLALNRSKHYRVEVFEQLLEAVSAAELDHAICTGDLVNLALEPEFEAVAGMLDRRFADDALTVVPGNHDYYVKDAVQAGLFERHFGRYQPHDLPLGGAPYPVTRVLDGVFIVGLNSAIATPVFMATGLLGDAQIAAMMAAFRAPAAEGRARVLMLHHPLLPDESRRTDPLRRLKDADALHAALRDLGPRAPHLIVHGHNHAFLTQTVPGTAIPIVQVASASRAASQRNRAEFNVFEFADGALVGIERHIHVPETGAFRRCDRDGQPLDSGLRAG